MEPCSGKTATKSSLRATADTHFTCLSPRNKEIDAVILDYEMPGMNGLELATWLKARHPTLPVIMISGSHPELQEMTPFVDAAMGKGVPLRHILDRLQVLLAA
jgi:DNA-binding response OmpR family regulator